MKKFWIFILFVVMLPTSLLAQRQTEYNRKGDEAMKLQDYSDARMWYEEGIIQCDSYSINQLTNIWKINKKMRLSMRSSMSKCLDCLIDKATIGNDSIAMSKLVVFYTEGIGTPINQERAGYWNNRLEELRRPIETLGYIPQNNRKPRNPMEFFVGYAFSIEAPYGLTVGGVGERFGWYGRFRTNLSFNNYTNKCRGDKELITIPENASYNFTNEKKSNNIAVSAGLVVKCVPWLYTSVGLGYGKRELLYEYYTTSHSDSKNKEFFWAKNTDYSYEGVVADLDFMVKFGPVFVSAGCNTLNFKYIDLNAGLGVFF